jgi:uncharacterized membrane protein
MIYIIIFIFGCLFYFWFECVINRTFNGPVCERALDKPDKAFIGHASLWMTPFGGLCGFFISLLYYLIFDNLIKHNSVFIILYILSSGATITVIELCGGLLLNIKFKLNIWDYSNVKFGDIPLNFKGQISLIHYLLWCGMGLIVILFLEFFKLYIK